MAHAQTYEPYAVYIYPGRPEDECSVLNPEISTWCRLKAGHAGDHESAYHGYPTWPQQGPPPLAPGD